MEEIEDLWFKKRRLMPLSLKSTIPGHDRRGIYGEIVMFDGRGESLGLRGRAFVGQPCTGLWVFKFN
jgi:hypothetical protein